MLLDGASICGERETRGSDRQKLWVLFIAWSGSADDVKTGYKRCHSNNVSLEREIGLNVTSWDQLEAW